MYSASDPVSMIIAIIIFVIIVAFCSSTTSKDAPKRDYSNKAYEFDENLDWDDSWDDKWLHQGEYADRDDSLDNTDWDPSWDENFRK
ncbi:hypothetical protein [Methanobrevibacter millerae]|uniref:Uncharacterized protein n=1 Tax=Methanobrevibacter millerae TaxID=230361 RepID=A0A1G5VL18_9EURY|nr:hypothetical protein [Methanobrevibacter millerae]SDA46583.1 hypothetical protein SAMN02910315_00718 [Methanobrevibacter millerae]